MVAWFSADSAGRLEHLSAHSASREISESVLRQERVGHAVWFLIWPLLFRRVLRFPVHQHKPVPSQALHVTCSKRSKLGARTMTSRASKSGKGQGLLVASSLHRGDKRKRICSTRRDAKESSTPMCHHNILRRNVQHADTFTGVSGTLKACSSA